VTPQGRGYGGHGGGHANGNYDYVRTDRTALECALNKCKVASKILQSALLCIMYSIICIIITLRTQSQSI